nr:hypothetical protein [Streptomyces sp. NBC_00582]
MGRVEEADVVGGAVPPSYDPTPVVGRRARELYEAGSRLYEAGARLYDAARTLRADHARALEAVRAAHAPLRDALVAEEFRNIPPSRLKEVTEGRLRLTALEAAGFDSVGAVHAASRHHKDRLFDAYARRSDTAEATPDAVDISDDGLARRIVEEEQLRLAGGAQKTTGVASPSSGHP